VRGSEAAAYAHPTTLKRKLKTLRGELSRVTSLAHRGDGKVPATFRGGAEGRARESRRAHQAASSKQRMRAAADFRERRRQQRRGDGRGGDDDDGADAGSGSSADDDFLSAEGRQPRVFGASDAAPPRQGRRGGKRSRAAREYTRLFDVVAGAWAFDAERGGAAGAGAAPVAVRVAKPREVECNGVPVARLYACNTRALNATCLQVRLAKAWVAVLPTCDVPCVACHDRCIFTDWWWRDRCARSPRLTRLES
jgi:hypothetical protein